MVEKIISLICEEFGYDEDAVSEETVLSDITEEGVSLDEIINIIEGEFYVDLSDEISGDMTVAQIAEMLE